jgi:FkbM family methyltransferase
VRSLAKELASMSAAVRPIRHGLHPYSALLLALGRTGNLRFRGARVRGGNRGLLIELAKSVWGGEYDAPGFVPGPGERVIDVGANVGLFAVLAASRGAVVEAYEPHPETFAYLVENAASWDVRCHRAAVVGRRPESGRVPLWLHPTHDSSHSLLDPGVVDEAPRTDSLEVEAVTLEEAIGDGCDLLKLDCEGAEFELIADTSADVLTRARRVVAEVHGRAGDGHELRSRLEGLGFATRIESKSAEHQLGLLFAARASADT